LIQARPRSLEPARLSAEPSPPSLGTGDFEKPDGGFELPGDILDVPSFLRDT